MSAGPFVAKAGHDPQTVECMLRPAVYAFVQDGQLYVRLKTEPGTMMSVLTYGQPTSADQSDGTYYLGAARLSAWNSFGEAIRISPANENTSTGGGSGSDSSGGLVMVWGCWAMKSRRRFSSVSY